MPSNNKTKLHAVPEQSTEELVELKQKIRIHRIKILVLVLLVLGTAAVAFNVVFLYLQRKTYTSYEVIAQIDRTDTEAANFTEFQGNILKYTRDGAVYSDASGDMIWNQTYEMETPRTDICGDYLTVYEQGGTSIYILNSTGLQGTIHTTIPIQRVSIGNQGTAAVLMEDSGTSYLQVYDREGKQLAAGELHIENSGYPLDIALSADAQKLAVSMLDINEGDIKTTIVFYNYGTVGQNEIDNIVGSYSYPDTVIPSIRFVSNDRLLAFGDSGVIIYEGTQKPSVAAQVNSPSEVISIYCNESYFGLVFDNEASASGYKTLIYNMKGSLVSELEFYMDYTDISLLENNLLCIHDDKSCMIYTLTGYKRFEYTFDRSIYSIISGGTQREFLLILNGETDRIRLKDE